MRFIRSQQIFTFYGGLYRGAHLICVPETHFELLHYGDLGIHAATEPASWDKEILCFTSEQRFAGGKR